MFWNVGYGLDSPVFEIDLRIAELAETLNRTTLLLQEKKSVFVYIQYILCVLIYIYIYI